MLRPALTVLLLAALPALATPADTGQLDASPSLFTVMAAINAAGYKAEWSSPNNHPIRAAIQTELAKRNIPSLVPLKEFFESHRKRTDAQELSQYISFALSCTGPPSFEFAIRDVEIPPDAIGLRDLSHLLAAFYKEADIADLWKRSQPAIEQYIARYHEPVTNAVLQVNGYMRQMTSGFKNRRFQIDIELQAAPNQIQTRSYSDNYTIVVTPSPGRARLRYPARLPALPPRPFGHPQRGDPQSQEEPGGSRHARPGAERRLQAGLPAAGHRIADQGGGIAAGPQAGR